MGLFDGVTKPIADVLGNAGEGVSELDEIGQTDFQATPPPINAANFVNPSAGNWDINSPVAPPAGQPSLRDALMVGFQAGDRPVDQAGHVGTFTPAPAQNQELNLGLLAPGVAATGAGTATAAYGLGQAEGTRELQRLNVGTLADAAAGRVPSAAEAQMKSGLGSTLRGNLALAASARGTAASRVAAQRAAADANAAASANVLGQTAALRAGEQATARQQLTGALEGIRSGDFQTAQTGLGMAQTGLGLGQLGLGAATAQLSSDTQTSLANLSSGTQLALGQLDANQAVELANLDARLRSRGMDDAQRIAYLGAILGIDARTQEGQMQLQQLMVEAGLKSDAINAQVAMANAGAQAQMVGAGLGAFGEFGASAF